ncbi:hypothetical protein OG933_15160 [Streptomyces sp. NBC_00016]|uniref:hypothetical protein n=1 Tax=Streptomyces sp. NBC_00016 TaxID=2975622 RepID=UPI00325063AE
MDDSPDASKSGLKTGDVSDASDMAPGKDPERLHLAYDAALGFLAKQDATLANLRNRAVTLLTIAALVATFASTVGLVVTDPSRGRTLPEWAAISLLVVLVAIGYVAIRISWPVIFYFGPTLADILDPRYTDTWSSPISPALINKLKSCIDRNNEVLRLRSKLFEVGALLLLAEVVILLAATLSDM